MKLPFGQQTEKFKKPLAQIGTKESQDPTKPVVDPLNQLSQGMVSVQVVIAPGAIEIDFD